MVPVPHILLPLVISVLLSLLYIDKVSINPPDGPLCLPEKSNVILGSTS
jgi:hypothetical protein